MSGKYHAAQPYGTLVLWRDEELARGAYVLAFYNNLSTYTNLTTTIWSEEPLTLGPDPAVTSAVLYVLQSGPTSLASDYGQKYIQRKDGYASKVKSKK